MQDFLLLINRNLGRLRYSNLLAKNHKFSLPSSLWNCRNNFMNPKTGVFLRRHGKDLMIPAGTIVDLSTRVTDGQTNRIAMAKMH